MAKAKAVKTMGAKARAVEKTAVKPDTILEGEAHERTVKCTSDEGGWNDNIDASSQTAAVAQDKPSHTHSGLTLFLQSLSPFTAFI